MDAQFPPEMMPCIRKFFSEEDSRPPGQLLYQEVFDTDLFFPLQRQEELREMMAAARAIQPKVVMEIGADKGGGLYHWVKCLPSVRMAIACEIRGTPYSEEFEKAFPRTIFQWLQCSSYAPETAERVKRMLQHCDDTINSLGPPLQIDCLFIDGDKTKFVEDFDAYLPLMNPNGIVFMHDIQDREPRRAFHRVVARGYEYWDITLLEDTKLALERERAGIPPASSHEGWLRYWKGDSAGVGVIVLGRGDKP